MSLIERIKEELTLEAVLDHFGAEVPTWRSRPFNVRCFLPGHDDVNPSMTIYPQEGRAWCYGCQRGGDLLDISAIMLNTDVRGGVKYWADRLGLQGFPISREERKRMHRDRVAREIKRRCHHFSHAIERGMPRPLGPDLVELWHYAFEVKDQIDEKAWQDGGPRDKQAAIPYVRELKVWRKRWSRLLAEANGEGWEGAKSLAQVKPIPPPSFLHPPAKLNRGVSGS